MFFLMGQGLVEHVGILQGQQEHSFLSSPPKWKQFEK